MENEAERPDRLVVRRVIPASREEVFAAWTDPESIRYWMCPGDALTAEAHLDPRVGGAFRIVMKSATRAYDHAGEYLVVDPPTKLAFTLDFERHRQPADDRDGRTVCARGRVRGGPHP